MDWFHELSKNSPTSNSGERRRYVRLLLEWLAAVLEPWATNICCWRLYWHRKKEHLATSCDLIQLRRLAVTDASPGWRAVTDRWRKTTVTRLARLLAKCRGSEAHACLRATIPMQWLAVANTNGGGEGTPPPLAHTFSKAAFFRVKGIYSISLCAFTISEDGADKLSSAPPPFQNFWIRHRWLAQRIYSVSSLWRTPQIVLYRSTQPSTVIAKIVLGGQIKSLASHTLASVLKATKQVNGKGQNSTPRHAETP